MPFQFEISSRRAFAEHNPERYFRSAQVYAYLLVSPRQPVDPMIKPAHLDVEIAKKRGRAFDDALDSNVSILDVSRVEVFGSFEPKICASHFDVHCRNINIKAQSHKA